MKGAIVSNEPECTTKKPLIAAFEDVESTIGETERLVSLVERTFNLLLEMVPGGEEEEGLGKSIDRNPIPIVQRLNMLDGRLRTINKDLSDIIDRSHI
jgi:hypothetical protein